MAVRRQEGLGAASGCLAGTPPAGLIEIHENGLKFQVDLLHGQKTGFYTDQRRNRQRVAAYCANMNKEIDMIAHSCGLKHAREFRREHVRIVQASGQSIALNVLYPYPAVPPGEGLISV